MKKILLFLIISLNLFANTRDITIIYWDPYQTTPYLMTPKDILHNVTDEQLEAFKNDKTTLYPQWEEGMKWSDDGSAPYYVNSADENIDDSVIEKDINLNYVDKDFIRKETSYESWETNSINYVMPQNNQPNTTTRQIEYMQPEPTFYYNQNYYNLITWVQEKNVDPSLCKYYWTIIDVPLYQRAMLELLESEYKKNSMIDYIVEQTENEILLPNEGISVSDINSQTLNSLLTLAGKNGDQLTGRVFIDEFDNITTQVLPSSDTIISELLMKNMQHQSLLTTEFYNDMKEIRNTVDVNELLYMPLPKSEYCSGLKRLID